MALEFLHALARIAAPEPYRVPGGRCDKRRVGREDHRPDGIAMALELLYILARIVAPEPYRAVVGGARNKEA